MILRLLGFYKLCTYTSQARRYSYSVEDAYFVHDIIASWLNLSYKVRATRTLRATRIYIEVNQMRIGVPMDRAVDRDLEINFEQGNQVNTFDCLDYLGGQIEFPW